MAKTKGDLILDQLPRALGEARIQAEHRVLAGRMASGLPAPEASGPLPQAPQASAPPAPAPAKPYRARRKRRS